MPMHIDEEIEEEGPKSEFKFHFLQDVNFESQSDAFRALLDKWGFGDEMCMAKFRVEQNVTPEDVPNMMRAFFSDQETLRVLTHVSQMRVTDAKKINLSATKILTGTVNMNFFNKFEEIGAISHTGHISGRIEEDWEGVPINNLIREAILMEESEIYDAFSKEDRKEFLFRIFMHVVFGGASNQYEDHVEEYFKMTKQLYKDLLTVRRNDSGDVEVVSQVYEAVSLGQGGYLFPKESPLNFCYVILDPIMRHITFWYFGYKPIW
jgi:hypothetical protein